MRHGKKTNHLSRKTAHRSALLSNMACSLIEHKRINTTLAKAKALRKYVEPLITKSKEDTTHNRRVVFRYLKNKDASSVLFRDVAPKISDRPGGYTRIIKLNNRLGDNAEMAMIELVDFNELLIKDQSKKKKTRRRGGKKATSEVQKPKENIEAIEDAVIIEESSESINSEKEASEKTKKDESPKSETKTPEEKDDSKTTDPPKEG
ncbi:MAG: 50S ribosomal protein L17 [Flavobacteriales bacterium]|jgi:large subunit ribosomal protein L17|nr:50S ribosomal protein L17 [Flavobacteriales bacterium]MDG1439377.1 50S ribosomal protein L17 [Flavobacteriales bacterium]